MIPREGLRPIFSFARITESPNKTKTESLHTKDHKTIDEEFHSARAQGKARRELKQEILYLLCLDIGKFIIG